jgi:hypothetical protein
MIDIGQKTMLKTGKLTGKLLTDTGKLTGKLLTDTGKRITDIDKTKTISKVMGTGKKFVGSGKKLFKTGLKSSKKTFKKTTKTLKKTTDLIKKYDKTHALEKTTGVLSDIDKKTRQKLQYETGDMAHAIAVKDSICLDMVKRAVESTKGFGETVNNSEIMEAFELLGREGVYADYASATTLAALIKLKQKNVVKKNERVVLVLTSHGLKNF